MGKYWNEEIECMAHEDMKKLQEDYQTKSQELLDLDITNRKLSKESKQNELYDELLDSQDKLAELTYQTRFAAMQAGINLTGDPTEWKKQLAALKDVPRRSRTRWTKPWRPRARWKPPGRRSLRFMKTASCG